MIFANLKKSLIIVFALSFVIIGCEEIDDQTIATGAEWAAANPKPLARDFVKINQAHQIIVASIDSGVDYNHPLLANNIHFTLNDQGQPIAFGYDFIGKDYWASPYVARTLDKNPEADPKDIKNAKSIRQRAEQLLTADKNLLKFLNPLRNVEQEFQTDAFHGTHVSGLMVYDDPRIGLIGYRVLPVNIKYKNGRKDFSDSKTEKVFKDILSAMSLAIKSGARVINMSLALRDTEANSLGNLLNNEQNNFNAWMLEVKKFMESNKDVVFVAAAGNEGKWVDDKVNLQIPCGISAENLVCVGALNTKGNLAAFSNIVLSDGVFVATLGVDIKSLSPSEMCDSANVGNLDGDYFSANDLNSLLTLVQKDCKTPQGIRTASGTSMASPIVARSVAKLMMKYPQANAVEIIKILVDSSQKKQLGPMTLNIIPFEKPSWY